MMMVDNNYSCRRAEGWGRDVEIKCVNYILPTIGTADINDVGHLERTPPPYDVLI